MRKYPDMSRYDKKEMPPSQECVLTSLGSDIPELEEQRTVSNTLPIDMFGMFGALLTSGDVTKTIPIGKPWEKGETVKILPLSIIGSDDYENVLTTGSLNSGTMFVKGSISAGSLKPVDPYYYAEDRAIAWEKEMENALPHIPDHVNFRPGVGSYTPAVGDFFYVTLCRDFTVSASGRLIEAQEGISSREYEGMIFQLLALDQHVLVGEIHFGYRYGDKRKALVRNRFKCTPVGDSVLKALGLGGVVENKT